MEGIANLKKTFTFSHRNNGQAIPSKLDPECIVKEGFLVKSPPQEHVIRKVARWHLRYLVLYDTKSRVDIDQIIEREVFIFYYKDDKSKEAGEKPLGKISLINANVVPRRGNLHNYKYAIDIYTVNRVWHLCAMQQPVIESWFTEIKSRSISSIPKVFTKDISPFKVAAMFFEPRKMLDISFKDKQDSEDWRRLSLPQQNLPRISVLHSDSLSPELRHSFYAQNTSNNDIEDSAKNTSKTMFNHVEDFDTDEGIIRTISDCSTCSTCTFSSVSSITTPSIPENKETTEYDKIFGPFSSAFQGPKLESNNLWKSRSQGNLLSPMEIPKSYSQSKIHHSANFPT
ncbi:uncharacterized protein LOC105846081 isoform X2 [Hydra vulgaris]|uniref:uncharacterized protein LOC105846081 isoform X2 n=1 Tax=Hydra vulgaris TaxID=6087 RepID=UPI001F5F3E66|nr:uncharacterized protein LOC105846081 isoform X2 [Hydra vulgaris]